MGHHTGTAFHFNSMFTQTVTHTSDSFPKVAWQARTAINFPQELLVCELLQNWFHSALRKLRCVVRGTSSYTTITFRVSIPRCTIASLVHRVRKMCMCGHKFPTLVQKGFGSGVTQVHSAAMCHGSVWLVLFHQFLQHG